MNVLLELFSTSLLTFGAIFLAEIGDKSQLVCMTLACRHKSKPIAFGAILAFSLLNMLAVTVGVSLSHFIPAHWIEVMAATLFALFGCHALFSGEDDEEEQTGVTKGKTIGGIFLTSFSMIFLAELGDKTQLAVVTLGTTHQPVAVWLGATMALGATSLIGIYAGRKFLSTLDIRLLHKLSGLVFIALAGLLFYECT